ncbi:MAG TPA: CHAT domain-containing protein, partial [Thermoanaerobaculia bacterium]
MRVLYAVAAPDALAEDARSSLDWEREEELIFDAVRATVPDAVFETADEGNLAYLEEVIESLRPHVVHLSGHGRRGALLLEDELGFERELTIGEFRTFLGKLPDATRLVVLAQCLSAADAGHVGGESPFAHFTAVAARERGYGVGMQFPVDDLAASWWAAGFYESLAEARYAELPRAVAAGRRRVWRETEARRQRAASPQEFDRSDWAAPVLYVAGGVFRLLEEREDGEASVKPPPPSLADVTPHRDRRAFVGRRRERRRLLRAVRREHRVGVVLRALGGTGKSTLAA